MIWRKKMAQRGRKSASSLTVVRPSSEIVSFIRRPEPPAELTDEQAEEWRAIVGVMPADHFMRGNYPLLAQCVAAAERRINNERSRNSERARAGSKRAQLELSVIESQLRLRGLLW
jgi:hypothetical protein